MWQWLVRLIRLTALRRIFSSDPDGRQPLNGLAAISFLRGI